MHLAELVEQTVHVLYLNAGTGGNAALARGLDQLGLAALFGRHAVDDALLANNVALGALQIGFAGFGRHLGGQLVHEAGQPAHLLHLLNLRQEVVQVKAITALDLAGQLLRGLHVNARGDLLHQGHDVAHAQNTPGMAFGIEHLQAVNFFAGTGKFDGRAGDLANRQRCTTARVAIGFGQDDAAQGQGLFEGFRCVDGVLALHGIDHEQGFNRVQSRMQLLNFPHQGFVNRQAAGGVHQQNIKVMALGVVEGCARNVHRLLARCARKPFGTGLGRHCFQLFDGGRAVDVGRHREHFFLALLNQVARQLGGRGGFTRTLQAGHQNHSRRLRRQIQVGHALAHGGGELTLHDAHQGLAGLEGAQDFLPK